MLHLSMSQEGGALSLPRLVGSIGAVINVGGDEDVNRNESEHIESQEEQRPALEVPMSSSELHSVA